MNQIVRELNRCGLPHAKAEDVFTYVRDMFERFQFLFKPAPECSSELRQLELVASLFDHVAVECVGDVMKLIDFDPGEAVGDE